MLCGHLPISKKHGDVMPTSSHGKKCLEVHLHKVGFVPLDFVFRKGREVTITFSSLLGTSLRV